MATNFTPVERGLPAISGDTADPDGDGIANLLEYAFNLNPRVANLPTGLPTVALVNLSGSFANQITFSRRLVNPEVSYIVETSSDLQTWLTGGATQISLGSSDGVVQMVTFRDNTPLNPPSVMQRFIRVRITRP